MAKGKQESEHDVTFAEGGDTPMFGGPGDHTTTASSDAAGEQTPGGTAHKTSGGAKQKFASGGSGKMFGFSPSVPATAGQTGAR
jgi:hypothetical protein